MINKKKFVLVNPLEVGKTTIQIVFYEQVNLISFLENSLQLLKAVYSSVFSSFNTDHGVINLER